MYTTLCYVTILPNLIAVFATFPFLVFFFGLFFAFIFSSATPPSRPFLLQPFLKARLRAILINVTDWLVPYCRVPVLQVCRQRRQHTQNLVNHTFVTLELSRLRPEIVNSLAGSSWTPGS